MRIYYFAWVRDHIGYSQEDIHCPETVKTISQLAAFLSQQSAGHAKAFDDLNAVRAAINQEFVNSDKRVKDTDEIAFFPPVTGG